MKHFNVTVKGLVQGVFFRASTKEQAKQLGITGFVKNQPDGSVYLEAEGEAEAMKELLAWLELGPPNAQVKNVDVEEDAVRDFAGFDISR
jgi:acylphosphatase